MSNVISLLAHLPAPAPDRFTALIAGFAQTRRLPDDVFWLKENAELLGIVRATGTPLGADALAPFEAFYEQIDARLRFFPQYYRFLLSLCLDLEDLGLPGQKGEALCAWAAKEGLAEAELSDLQRAEARRLLARRGVKPPVDPGLDARLHAFINRPETFVMPNKKAAYELTHIVFYLSEYGSRDPSLDEAACVSLEYTGLLAYLDQNADLLAEVCTALRFAGQTPSALWEEFVATQHCGIAPVADAAGLLQDAYHAYLVTGWAGLVAGQTAFDTPIPQDALRFVPAARQPGALRSLSECLLELGDQRSAQWTRMRPQVLPHLGQTGQQVLRDAEASTDRFEGFFSGFARAG